MFKVKPKESKTGMKLKVHNKHEIFIGTKTIVAFLGFTIGGILVGRSIWEYGVNSMGLELTTLTGIVLFIVSGAILHKFQS